MKFYQLRFNKLMPLALSIFCDSQQGYIVYFKGYYMGDFIELSYHSEKEDLLSIVVEITNLCEKQLKDDNYELEW